MTSASLSLLNIIRFYHKYSSWARDDTNRTALQISLVLWMICQSRQCLSLTIFVLFMKFPSLKYHYHIYTARAWPISFEGGINFLVFLAATKQLYEWYFLSVCPSVRPSVRLSVCPSVTPFWLCSHHRIIMKFSGVITLDQGKVHAQGQGQRSKVKVTDVTTQIFVSGL